MSVSRRSFGKGLIGIAMLGAAPGPALAADDPWPGLRDDIFPGRTIAEEDGVVALDAPTRAHDAALTPLTITAAPQHAVRSLTLVVDQNPSPVVATFAFGEAAGPLVLSTRVRIDAYSNVRAIAETADGTLHMATKFVKAAGGCSAPAGKDQDKALAELGRMQMRLLPVSDPASPAREAQLMIRHPNNSGLQRDQLTGLSIPAMFVREIEVRQGGKLVFRMEGGISISEDPNIRFTYRPDAGPNLEVVARDTEDRTFRGSWPATPGRDS